MGEKSIHRFLVSVACENDKQSGLLKSALRDMFYTWKKASEKAEGDWEKAGRLAVFLENHGTTVGDVAVLGTPELVSVVEMGEEAAKKFPWARSEDPEGGGISPVERHRKPREADEEGEAVLFPRFTAECPRCGWLGQRGETATTEVAGGPLEGYSLPACPKCGNHKLTWTMRNIKGEAVQTFRQKVLVPEKGVPDGETAKSAEGRKRPKPPRQVLPMASVYDALEAIESAAEPPEDVTCGVGGTVRDFLQGQKNGLQMAASILRAAVGRDRIQAEASARVGRGSGV